MLALSVSISTSSAPRSTCSPSAISQRRIVPCSIVSERRGMTISARLLASDPGVPLIGSARSSDQIQCRAGDRLGVDAEVAVEVLHVAGLAEVLHAETGDRQAADGG